MNNPEKVASAVKKASLSLHLLYRRWNASLKNKKLSLMTDQTFLSTAQKKEINDYWNRYTNKYNLLFFSYYSSRTGVFDKRYVPDDLYYSYIDLYYNKYNMTAGIDNKAYYSILFPELIKPKTVFLKLNGFYYDTNFNLMNPSDIVSILGTKECILKPVLDSKSGGGKGILFLKRVNPSDCMNIFISRNDYIVQEVVKQHSALASLHPESINTVRIISLLQNNEVKVLSSVLRMGISDSVVDNASAGGIVVGIDGNGTLKQYAYSVISRDRYEKHPNTGVVLKGFSIPGYFKLVEIVKHAAIKFPYFRLISWDFSISEDAEPCFIEFNLKSGQLDFHQLTNGPIFGEITEEVLSEVWRKKGD